MHDRRAEPAHHLQDQAFLQAPLEAPSQHRAPAVANPQFVEHHMSGCRSSERAKAIPETPDESAAIKAIRDELDADPVRAEGLDAGAGPADAVLPRRGGSNPQRVPAVTAGGTGGRDSCVCNRVAIVERDQLRMMPLTYEAVRKPAGIVTDAVPTGLE